MLSGLLSTPSLGGTVRFCFNEWPPYTYFKNGKATGVSVAILSEAAGRAGLEPKFQELPWKRCLNMVLAGRIDAVVDAAQRDEYLQGPVSHSIYTDTFWVRAGSAITAVNLQDMRDKSIGLVSGYKYGKALAPMIASPAVDKEYSVDDTSNVRMLKFGRVDVIVGDHVGTKSIADKLGVSLRPLLPSPSFDRLYPSFNRNQTQLHRKIDDALKTMMDDGTVDAIYRREIGIPFADLVDTPNAPD